MGFYSFQALKDDVQEEITVEGQSRIVLTKNRAA